jgi:hypothetical protein
LFFYFPAKTYCISFAASYNEIIVLTI